MHWKERNGCIIQSNLKCTDAHISELTHISKSYSEKFNRVRRQDLTIGRIYKRSLKEGLVKIKKSVSLLELPSSVLKSACYYYKKYCADNLLLGYSVAQLGAACITVGCRLLSVPLILNKLLEEFEVKQSQLFRTVQMLVTKLNIRLKPKSPKLYLSAFCNALGLPPIIERKALDLLSELPEMYILGKKPRGICAACIYFITKIYSIKITQLRLSKIAGITALTLRTRFNEVREKFGF